MTRKIYHLAPNGSSESSAAWRILRAQLMGGAQAEKLVFKKPGLFGVVPYANHKTSELIYNLTSKANAVLMRILYKNKMSLPWSLNILKPPGFSKRTYSRMSILNIHWLPSTFNKLDSQTQNIPVILTSHDVWNLTGGCHCNLGCEGWRNGCLECPQVFSRFRVLHTPAKSFKSKMKFYKSIPNLGIVAPSKWIANMYAQSPMFKGRRIEVIPNPGNTSIYRPTNEYSHLLKISRNSNTIRLLYVVSGNVDTYHKGFDLLLKILKNTTPVAGKEFELVIVGDARNARSKLINFSTIYYDEVHNEEEMSGLINSADLVISTSRQDNLPNTLVESVLCGTPVLAFNIGGISEIITNNINGILIEPFDIGSFGKTLTKFINGAANLTSSRDEIARLAKNIFSEELIALRYAKFYESMKSVLE